MELKDYSTEELRAELKKRYAELKAERAKIKRCRDCKYFGKVNYYGEPLDNPTIWLGSSRCCQFFKWKKSTKYYLVHKPYQVACEHFEENN